MLRIQQEVCSQKAKWS